MPEQALSGIKVLDLSTYISGPYCTRLLTGFGAEVIKVEKPGEGDPARRIGPFYQDVPHPEKSGLFLYLNTGKKSITLNLETETGGRIFKELAKGADVVVESFEPGEMARLGLGYEVLEGINPRLILTSVSYFGQTGPYCNYKGVEIVAFALGGFMSTTGEPSREPLKPYGSQAEYHAGLNAAVAILLALHAREETDLGQHVDISAMESVASLLLRAAWTHDNPGRVVKRAGPRTPEAYPSTTLPCKDGYVHAHDGQRNWETLASLVEEPRLLEPSIRQAPSQHADEIDDLLLPWLARHCKEEILRSAQEQRIPFTAVLSVDEVLRDPQHQARGFFEEIDHPMTGRLTYPGAPFKMSETPWQAARAPLLGEDNEKIYSRWLGFVREDLVKLREMGII